jgi:hypothetical protein
MKFAIGVDAHVLVANEKRERRSDRATFFQTRENLDRVASERLARASTESATPTREHRVDRGDVDGEPRRKPFEHRDESLAVGLRRAETETFHAGKGYRTFTQTSPSKSRSSRSRAAPSDGGVHAPTMDSRGIRSNPERASDSGTRSPGTRPQRRANFDSTTATEPFGAKLRAPLP